MLLPHMALQNTVSCSELSPRSSKQIGLRGLVFRTQPQRESEIRQTWVLHSEMGLPEGGDFHGGDGGCCLAGR